MSEFTSTGHGEQPSLYGESQSVRHYSDLDDDALLDKTIYYSELEQSGELMPRAHAMAARILDHLVFEAGWRWAHALDASVVAVERHETPAVTRSQSETTN